MLHRPTNSPARQGSDVQIRLDLGWLARAVTLASAGILAASYIRLVTILAFGMETPIGNFRFFDLDDERSIPTWYSSLLLIGCAVLLLTISRLVNRTGGVDLTRWTALSGVFAYLAFDEAVSIHERVSEPLRDTLGLTGAFHYSWVIPAAVLLAAFGLYMLPFMFRLSRRTAVLFAIAGAVFVSGALGMELVSGIIVSQAGTEVASYQIVVTIEESLEIIGTTIFFVTLVDYIGRTWPAWTMAVRSAVAPPGLTNSA
jgi:hypothetical protein